ncbi:7 transmembrane receptor (rhodopsin) [Mactra antiquata]
MAMNTSKAYDNIFGNKTLSELYVRLKPYAKECFYVALGLQWLMTILIISLNITVIVTIVRYKKKSRLYFLLMNMAIADLTTGVVDAFVNSIERSLGIEFLNYYWFADDVTCRIYKTASQVSMMASNFILAATSLDRALVVAKPMMNFKRGFVLQKSLIAFCWLLSLAVSSPLLFRSHKTVLEVTHLSDNSTFPYCDPGIEGTEQWKIFLFIFLGSTALLPLVIIITSYIILIHAIYKRARSPPNSVKGMDNLRVSLVFNRGLPSSKTRSVKLTLGIVLSFIAAWTPFFVLMFLNVYGIFNNPLVMPFVTTYYWNCIANPIIFFVFHRRRRPTSSANYSTCDNPLLRHSTTLSSSRNTSIRAHEMVKTSPLVANSTKPDEI